MIDHDQEEITAPSTQEDRLRTVAETALNESGIGGPWPIVADWPDGPLKVFVAPAESDGEHMPKTVLLLIDFDHAGHGYVAFLGGND
ncbi:MAG: hypothetical protein HGA31_02480 [Candidatus Moranbacteria bacterium]|nr:hypothetical protein [Candidatus Moranbacteria bacterium]